jgi:ABC-type multidrug transport system fused ATPase/permease subunit
VALARAVYRGKDIYLLDDVLSAVDSHVGRQLVERCIKEALAGSTRLVVTHHLALCREADYIYLLSEGRIAGHGSFQAMLSQPLFATLYQSF